jgi:hypothetical protein
MADKEAEQESPLEDDRRVLHIPNVAIARD